MEVPNTKLQGNPANWSPADTMRTDGHNGANNGPKMPNERLVESQLKLFPIQAWTDP
jgi:hypothetical protein